MVLMNRLLILWLAQGLVCGILLTTLAAGGHNEKTKEVVQSILRGTHRNHTAAGVRKSHDGAQGHDIEAGFLNRDIGAGFLNRDIGAGCKCVDYDCGCCAYWRAEWSLVIINERVCANISYLPDQEGFRVTLTFDEFQLINETISVHNPPPILCQMDRFYTSYCLEIHDVTYKDGRLNGCLYIQKRILLTKLSSIKLGCFHIPVEERRAIDGMMRLSDENLIEGTSERCLRQFFHNSTNVEKFRLEKLGGNGCRCAGDNCGCCYNFLFPKLRIKEPGCVNVSYLPDQKGFRMTLVINDVTAINVTVSANNPPPVCIDVPHMGQMVASICLDFYNLDYFNRTLSGCLKLEAHCQRLVVDSLDFRCFDIPLIGNEPQDQVAIGIKQMITARSKN